MTPPLRPSFIPCCVACLFPLFVKSGVVGWGRIEVGSEGANDTYGVPGRQGERGKFIHTIII